ncbi:MAG: hypothetical protein SFX72_11795 [Isosphaeraceae bacterium]|nr:hypothetical protein [Isosphaeraceae bacterium]
MQKSTRVLAFLALSLSGMPQVEAGNVYQFTRVATVTGANGGRFWAPVVNDSGMVAYSADAGIFRGGGSGAPSLVADTIHAFRASISMNNAGRLSYSRSFPEYRDRSALMLDQGSKSQTLMIEDDLTAGISASSINELGSVVTGLSSQHDSIRGIYLSQNGQSAGRIYGPGGGIRHFGTDPVINDRSQIAFWAQGEIAPGGALVLGDTSGAAPTVLFRASDLALTPTEQSGIGNGYDLNDRGQVAFLTSTFDRLGGPTRYGVHVASAGAVATIATFVSDLAGFSDHSIALNDSGSLAFYFAIDGLGGIYTGGDLLADKVIRDGDRLDGGRVFGLRFGRFGLNERGQLAFHATIIGDDGVVRDGIYLATPVNGVPEPSTRAGLGVGLVAASIALGRRRAINPNYKKM